MIYFNLRPITFDENGRFKKAHRLSAFWLKKYDYEIQKNRYVLKGKTLLDDFFEAYFDQQGKFLFITIKNWSHVARKRTPHLELHFSHLTQTLMADGQKFLEEKNYQVIPCDEKNASFPDSSTYILRKELSEALKHKDFIYDPEKIIAKILKVTRTSVLSPDKIAIEVQIPNEDGHLFYQKSDPEKNIYFIMPEEHTEFWKDVIDY